MASYIQRVRKQLFPLVTFVWYIRYQRYYQILSGEGEGSRYFATKCWRLLPGHHVVHLLQVPPCYTGVATCTTRQQIMQKYPKGIYHCFQFSNVLNYTVMALGNHDFDDGTSGLQPFVDQVTSIKN